jgi:hypothetical protein
MSSAERELASGLHPAQTATVLSWLENLLWARMQSALAAELRGRALELRGASDREFFKAFALLPRITGKDACLLAGSESALADKFWDGAEWPALRMDELARLWLVLTACPEIEVLLRRAEALFTMADVSELVTLYRGLPLYPQGERWAARAAEGVRSNMKSVYEAVALRNPYPSRWLSDAAFNHLVLKALHVESPLEAIHGLQARRNPELVRMLCDYVSERRSAKRSIDPAVWKLVDDATVHSLSSTKRTEV